MNKILCKDIINVINEFRFGNKESWEKEFWEEEYDKVLNQYIMCQMHYHAKIRFFDGPGTDYDLWFSQISAKDIKLAWRELGCGRSNDPRHLKWFEQYKVSKVKKYR